MSDYKLLNNFIKDLFINTYLESKKLDIKINYKNKEDIVTNIDLFIENTIISEIKKKYPNDIILSEESHPDQLLTNDRIWTIDPIDGTSNFSHKFGLYCIQCSLIENLEILYSAIYIPELNMYFHAIKGQGAFQNDVLIQPSKTNKLSNELISFVGLSNPLGNRKKYNDLIKFSSENNLKIRVLGSIGVEMAFVASGSFIYLYTDIKNIWDISPGLLLVKEAGCLTLNEFNKEYKLNDNELTIYANKDIYELTKHLK